MTNNTLTTLDRLKPGDIFLFEKQKIKGTQFKPGFYTKVPGELVYKHKEKLTCWAIPEGGIIPVPMLGNSEVIFIKKSKKIYI